MSVSSARELDDGDDESCASSDSASSVLAHMGRIPVTRRTITSPGSLLQIFAADDGQFDEAMYDAAFLSTPSSEHIARFRQIWVRDGYRFTAMLHAPGGVDVSPSYTAPNSLDHLHLNGSYPWRVDVNATNPMGCSLLARAIADVGPHTFNRMLKQSNLAIGQRLGGSNDDTDHQATGGGAVDRCTPLQVAAFHDRDGNLEQVLASGRASGRPLDVDETTADQHETALLLAVYRAVAKAPHGDFPCVKRLIEASAVITPAMLRIAESTGHTALRDYLGPLLLSAVGIWEFGVWLRAELVDLHARITGGTGGALYPAPTVSHRDSFNRLLMSLPRFLLLDVLNFYATPEYKPLPSRQWGAWDNNLQSCDLDQPTDPADYRGSVAFPETLGYCPSFGSYHESDEEQEQPPSDFDEDDGSAISDLSVHSFYWGPSDDEDDDSRRA